MQQVKKGVKGFVKVPLEERFWSKVRKMRTCWEWAGARASWNRGQISYEGKTHMAHRVSWMLAFGAIPGGLQICHRCDNPLCVRPSHLFLGTQKDNMQDCIRKGRFKVNPKQGEKHHSAKLTDDDVRSVRTWSRFGYSSYEIAAKFRVHPATIQRILNRKAWRHVV